MKYLKITVTIFVFTICFAFCNAHAEEFGVTGYVGINLKNLSQSTTIDKKDKSTYSYQSAKKNSAIDSLSGDERAVQAKVTNSSWIDLPKGQTVSWKEALTYYSGTYTHYVKLKKSTLSTASYYGWWYWDKEV